MTEISGGAPNGANGRSVPYVNGKTSYAEKHNIADHFIGGNRVEAAPPSKVKEFVAQNDGHTVITNVRIPCLRNFLLSCLLALFSHLWKGLAQLEGESFSRWYFVG